MVFDSNNRSACGTGRLHHCRIDGFREPGRDDSDLDAAGKLDTSRKVEPLILRAAAGECITVKLTNRLPTKPMNVGRPSAITGQTLNTSYRVGLHAQLVSYDVTTANGINLGMNPDLTVAPGSSGTVTWYAGITSPDGTHTAVEFGAISLTPSDPLMQHPYGLLGALIIEPEHSTWTEDNP